MNSPPAGGPGFSGRLFYGVNETAGACDLARNDRCLPRLRHPTSHRFQSDPCHGIPRAVETSRKINSPFSIRQEYRPVFHGCLVSKTPRPPPSAAAPGERPPENRMMNEPAELSAGLIFLLLRPHCGVCVSLHLAKIESTVITIGPMPHPIAAGFHFADESSNK